MNWQRADQLAAAGQPPAPAHEQARPVDAQLAARCEKTYYPQLDALRAIAVLLVLFSHFFAGGPWGDYGVRLFFVLSGFLITSIILTVKDGIHDSRLTLAAAARSFFVRRSLRLFPIYYLVLLIYLGIAYATDAEVGGIRQDWPYHFAYLTNVLVFLRGEWVGPLSPYWSLAVEEQFYIGWFWIVVLTTRRHLPLVALAFFVGSVAFRLLSYVAGADHYADFLLPACSDTLAAGALLAIGTHARYRGDFAGLRRWLAQRREAWPLVAAGLGVALVLCSYGLDKDHLARRLATNVLSSLIFAYLVFRCYVGVTGRCGRLLSMPALVALGKVSYGIYVYHMLALYICRRYIPLHLYDAADGSALFFVQRLVDFFVPALLTLALAKLSWRFVESPVLRLKERFDYA